MTIYERVRLTILEGMSQEDAWSKNVEELITDKINRMTNSEFLWAISEAHIEDQ